jgi:hypothetical protein
MNRISLSIMLIFGVIGAALAQTPVTVVGPIAPGNCATFNSTTILKDSGIQCPGGGGSGSGTFNTATVRIQRVLPPPTVYGTATWAAYSPTGAFLCSAQSGFFAACMSTAVNAAFPYASGTTAAGYPFEIIGGDEPAAGSGHNFGGGGALLQTATAIQFPPLQNASITVGSLTLGAIGNDTLIFDSCEECDIDFRGAQVVYDFGTPSTTQMAVRWKPTRGTPFDGNFGISPVRAVFTSIVGRMRFDLTGNANANVDFLNLKIVEANWSTTLTGGCAILFDSPVTGQNSGFNRIEIDQLHGNGGIGTAYCDGTQAPGSGALLGKNYVSIGIAFDTSGAGNGMDEWGSGSEIHIRAAGITTGYTLKFESGACNNIAYITSDQASPTVTDSSGCTGTQCNSWYLNGSLFLCGVAITGNLSASQIVIPLGTVASSCVPGLAFPGLASYGIAASSGNLVLCNNSVLSVNFTSTGLRIPSGQVYGWSSNTSNTGGFDTAISRLGAASAALGNGTAADFSGSLKLSTVTLGTSSTLNSSGLIPQTDNTGSLGTLTGPFRWANIVGVNVAAAAAILSSAGHGTPAGGDGAGISLSVAAFGVFYGSGAPTMSANQGSLYLRTDGSSTSTRAYINNNGSTSWSPITTGS